MKDDTISRQAVLKLLHSLPPEEAMTKAMLIQSVQQMDAAQPDGPDNLVNDCISRQAAIERIESHIRVGDELYPLTDTDKILNHAFEIAASCVYNLPSAQPDRKRGKWIYGEDNLGTGRDGWFCSECGHFEVWDYSADMKSAELNLPNYCPNCGADMRGKQDDSISN